MTPTPWFPPLHSVELSGDSGEAAKWTHGRSATGCSLEALAGTMGYHGIFEFEF